MPYAVGSMMNGFVPSQNISIPRGDLLVVRGASTIRSLDDDRINYVANQLYRLFGPASEQSN